jgi:competence protein ComEA
MLLKTLTLASALSLNTLCVASPVNVNMSSTQDIAKALNGVSFHLAERIQMHCEIMTCRKPDDLLPVRGMNPELLEKIQHDLRFSIIDKGLVIGDDC